MTDNLTKIRIHFYACELCEQTVNHNLSSRERERERERERRRLKREIMMVIILYYSRIKI